MASEFDQIYPPLRYPEPVVSASTELLQCASAVLDNWDFLTVDEMRDAELLFSALARIARERREREEGK